MNPKYASNSVSVTFSHVSYVFSPIHCKAYKLVWSTMSCSRDVVKNKRKICIGVGGICTVGPTGSVKAVIRLVKADQSIQNEKGGNSFMGKNNKYGFGSA